MMSWRSTGPRADRSRTSEVLKPTASNFLDSRSSVVGVRVGVRMGISTVGSITAPGENVGVGVGMSGVGDGVGVGVNVGSGVGVIVAVGAGVAVGGAGVAVGVAVGKGVFVDGTRVGSGVGAGSFEQATDNNITNDNTPISRNASPSPNVACNRNFHRFEAAQGCWNYVSIKAKRRPCQGWSGVGASRIRLHIKWPPQ